MKRTQDIELLRSQSRAIGERGRFCPDRHQLAAFFEGSLGTQKRSQFERHLSNCSYCLAQIGMLERAASDPELAEVPETLLASAKQLGRSASVTQSRNAPNRARAGLAVAAALAALLIAPQFLFDDRTAPAPAVTPAQDGPRQFRGPEAVTSELPAILSPAEGSAVTASDLQVRWTEMSGALYYELQVMSEGGEILHEERVEGTHWDWQVGGELVPGRDYYFRVVAHLDDGRTLKSNHTRVQAASER